MNIQIVCFGENLHTLFKTKSVTFFKNISFFLNYSSLKKHVLLILFFAVLSTLENFSNL